MASFVRSVGSWGEFRDLVGVLVLGATDAAVRKLEGTRLGVETARPLGGFGTGAEAAEAGASPYSGRCGVGGSLRELGCVT